MKYFHRNGYYDIEEIIDFVRRRNEEKQNRVENYLDFEWENPKISYFGDIAVRITFFPGKPIEYSVILQSNKNSGKNGK